MWYVAHTELRNFDPSTDVPGPCILRQDQARCHEVGTVSRARRVSRIVDVDADGQQAEKQLVAS